MRKNKNLGIDYAIDDFMIYCQEKDLRIKTITSYESTLRLFDRYIEDTFKVNNVNLITDKMCKDYITYTKERGKYTFLSNDYSKGINFPENRKDYGKKVSVTTVNNYIRNLKVFFNYLEDKNVIKKNPMKKIKQFKNKRIPKDQLSDKDFKKIIRCMDTTKFHEFRDYVIIQIIMDTGMRIGECLALQVKDIDIDRRAVFISGDIAKGRKDRYVFYSYTMSKLLRRWMQYKDRYVETDNLFCVKRGSQLSIGNFETNFAKYVKRARIEKNITAHGLRNNYARRFLLAGGDIFMLSRLLGHSSVTVTEKAYADVTTEDIRKNYQQFSPLENMRGGRR
ncbi:MULTISPECIES: tyrosine-type recombinase/integrase [Clostridium]|uniref:tyrosine-type recombinase/integrase n=1 Tax=Clostridium TaxID=1485 RepID=UPI0008248823|nr:MULTISPECIES: tyrosine-type recombinase/integrase [Clostridium]PJI09950.1 integrase [Clostridium sp. CT7]